MWWEEHIWAICSYVWDNLCYLEKPPKCTKKFIKMAKKHTVFYQTETSRTKVISVDKAYCQLSVVTRSSFVQYKRCSSPNKWRFQMALLQVGVSLGFWPNKSSISPTKWLSQCRHSHFDSECLFLVATITWVEMESLKVVLYRVSMDEGNWNSSK